MRYDEVHFQLVCEPIHGPEDFLSHFHYASLEPPATELEAWSANAIAEAYTSMKVPSGWGAIWYEVTMNTLESLLDNDPHVCLCSCLNFEGDIR